MKVLVFVKATPNSEKGLPPAAEMQEMFRLMGEYNERLVKAGIMKEGDGLKPSSAAKRLKFSDSGHVATIDGPFAETKELVAGYWVWEVKSMDEAVEWARQCPNPMPGEEGVLEIRPTYTAEDFGEMLPPEEREREHRLRKEVAAQTKRAAKSAQRPARKPAKKSAAKPKRGAAKNASAKKSARKVSAKKAKAKK